MVALPFPMIISGSLPAEIVIDVSPAFSSAGSSERGGAVSVPMPAAASPPGEAAAGAAKAGTSANGAPFGLVFLVFTSCHSSTFGMTS